MRLKRLELAALAGLALLGFACRTVPRGETPRKAIVLSFDGAAAEELVRLHAEGAFGADGFARVLREGEAARRMVPVNPSLTAVNHISLATGAPPARTGIVSNTFHLPSESISRRADGFSTPYDGEPLWQAARRQGKRVGVVCWPGVGAAGTPRQADWALTWTSALLRPAKLLDIAAADWRPAAPESPAGTSFSPPREALVALPAEKSFPAQTLRLRLLDRRDDGATSYDALEVRDAEGGEAVVLGAGDAGALVLAAAGESSPAAQGIELLELQGDGAARLYFARLYRNAAYPAGYERRLAAERLLWPAAPDDDALEAAWAGEPGLTLDQWVRQSDRFAAFFVDALLAGLRSQEWDLAMGYVPTIDEAEHQLLLADPRQPDWSAERQRAFADARRRVWQSADREVARLLRSVDPRTTAVFLVSDHGLAPAHTAIDANAVLRAAGLLRVADGKLVESETRLAAFGSGAVAHLYANLAGREPGGVVGVAERDALVAQAREVFSSLRVAGESPVARLAAHEELGPLGLAHRNAGDLVLFAAPGYWFASSRPLASQVHFPTPAYGQHGYLNHEPRMHAIYLAWGAGVSPRSFDRLSSTEVAARVARRLGIEPPAGADG